MDIGQKLREIRTALKITQSEIAYHIGVTRKQYIRYEAGENDMSAKKLQKFCIYTCTSADYILGLETIGTKGM